jgi:hypothetical protein
MWLDRAPMFEITGQQTISRTFERPVAVIGEAA